MRDYRGEAKWGPSDTGEEFIQTVVVPAASEDAEIFRAVRRRGMQLDPVGALAKNTKVRERGRARAAVQAPPTPPSPTRVELLSIIAAARPAKRSNRQLSNSILAKLPSANPACNT